MEEESFKDIISEKFWGEKSNKRENLPNPLHCLTSNPTNAFKVAFVVENMFTANLIQAFLYVNTYNFDKKNIFICKYI